MIKRRNKTSDSRRNDCDSQPLKKQNEYISSNFYPCFRKIKAREHFPQSNRSFSYYEDKMKHKQSQFTPQEGQTQVQNQSQMESLCEDLSVNYNQQNLKAQDQKSIQVLKNYFKRRYEMQTQRIIERDTKRKKFQKFSILPIKSTIDTEEDASFVFQTEPSIQKYSPSFAQLPQEDSLITSTEASTLNKGGQFKLYQLQDKLISRIRLNSDKKSDYAAKQLNLLTNSQIKYSALKEDNLQIADKEEGKMKGSYSLLELQQAKDNLSKNNYLDSIILDSNASQTKNRQLSQAIPLLTWDGLENTHTTTSNSRLQSRQTPTTKIRESLGRCKSALSGETKKQHLPFRIFKDIPILPEPIHAKGTLLKKQNNHNTLRNISNQKFRYIQNASLLVHQFIQETEKHPPQLSQLTKNLHNQNQSEFLKYANFQDHLFKQISILQQHINQGENIDKNTQEPPKRNIIPQVQDRSHSSLSHNSKISEQKEDEPGTTSGYFNSSFHQSSQKMPSRAEHQTQSASRQSNSQKGRKIRKDWESSKEAVQMKSVQGLLKQFGISKKSHLQ